MWSKQPWQRVHEAELNRNIERFRTALDQSAPASPTQLKHQIELYNDYEDYIYKSRQAEHIHLQVYGPTVTAIASAVIALALAIVAVVSYLRPPPQGEADIVMRIIEKSDQAHVASNLVAFREAGLITINDGKSAKLTADWRASSK